MGVGTSQLLVVHPKLFTQSRQDKDSQVREMPNKKSMGFGVNDDDLRKYSRNADFVCRLLIHAAQGGLS